MHDRPHSGGYRGSVDGVSTVIIEGPDGTGKSTLLHRLLNKYRGYQSAPRACSSLGGPLPSESMIGYLDLYGCLEGRIYDRHPSISGAVYDAALSRTPSDNVMTRLQGAFHWILENAKVIYCRPPMDVIVGSVHSKPQLDGVARNIYRIVDMYDSLMANLIPHERYDWTQDDLPDL